MKKIILFLTITIAAFAQAPAPGPQITGYCRAPQNLVQGRPDNFAANGPEMPAGVSPALQALVTSQKCENKRLRRSHPGPLDRRLLADPRLPCLPRSTDHPQHPAESRRHGGE